MGLKIKLDIGGKETIGIMRIADMRISRGSLNCPPGFNYGFSISCKEKPPENDLKKFNMAVKYVIFDEREEKILTKGVAILPYRISEKINALENAYNFLKKTHKDFKNSEDVLDNI